MQVTLAKLIDIFGIVFAIIIMTLGICGNITIIYILKYRMRSPLSSYDTILVYLAVNDLLCAAVAPTVYVYRTVTNFREWLLGDISCKVVMSALPVNTSISQGLLVLISLERYKALTKPLERRNIGQKRIALVFVCIFVISIILVLPRMLASSIVINKKYETSTCTSSSDKNMHMLVYSVISLIKDLACTLVLALTGRLISRFLKQNALAQESYSQSRRQEELKLSKHRSKMLRNIVIAFIVCTIPHDVYQLCVYTTFQILKDKIPPSVYSWLRSINTVLYLLKNSSVAVNVFIYSKKYAPFDGLFRRVSAIPSRLARTISSRYVSADLETRSYQNEIATIRRIVEPDAAESIM